jgi:hypothetical protein
MVCQLSEHELQKRVKFVSYKFILAIVFKYAVRCSGVSPPILLM